jgi:hypothetical protein
MITANFVCCIFYKQSFEPIERRQSNASLFRSTGGVGIDGGMLAFCPTSNTSSHYLSSVVSIRACCINFINFDYSLLQCSRAKPVFGSRALRHSASTLWISPPSAITDDFSSISLNVFKHKLEAWLFNNSYTI